MFEKPALDFFEDMPVLLARYPRTDSGELGWLPAVDIQETPSELIVRAALPGVEKEDIVVEVEAESVTLSGRRRGRDGDGWLRRELISGPFNRSLPLPANVRAAEAAASQKDGILEIRIPKEQAGKPQALKVN